MKKVLIPVFLFMVLVLVPFKNAYALTRDEVRAVQPYWLTYTQTHSFAYTSDKPWSEWLCISGSNNGYNSFYNNTNQPITINGYVKLSWESDYHKDESMTMTIQPYQRVNWTKDPIELKNANFSIAKFQGDSIQPSVYQTPVNWETLPSAPPPPVTLPDYSPLEFNILRPSQGYTDTVDGFETLISFKLPPNTMSQFINIKLESNGIAQENHVIKRWEYNVSSGIGLVSYFTSPVEVGSHDINITLNGVTKTVNYTRLGGIVDENEDGLDDRTGLPVGDGHSDDPIPDGTFISNTINNLKSLFTEFTGFQTFIKSFLSVFPTWITIPIASLFGVMIVMAILKVIRG